MEMMGCCSRSHRRYEEIETAAAVSPAKLRWRALWKKMKREKQKLFMESSGHQHHVPCYDACSYAKNFDGGFTWDEPENLSRSFSVRFADPSGRRVFLRSDKSSSRIKATSS